MEIEDLPEAVCIGTKYDPRLSKKYRIPVENVKGYWKGRTSARPESMIPIRTRRG